MNTLPKLAPVQLMVIASMRGPQIADMERNGPDAGWSRFNQILEEVWHNYGLFPNEQMVKLVEDGVFEQQPMNSPKFHPDNVRLSSGVLDQWHRIEAMVRAVQPGDWPKKRDLRPETPKLDLADFDPSKLVEEVPEPEFPPAKRVGPGRPKAVNLPGKTMAQRAAAATMGMTGRDNAVEEDLKALRGDEE